MFLQLLFLEVQVANLFAEHEAGSQAGHLRVTNLTDERHGAACTRVSFEDEHLAVFDGVLHVHEAAKRRKVSVATKLAWA